MKKYRFGDILLVARAEYEDCKRLLDELNQLIDIDETVKHHHIEGTLREENDPIKEAKLRLVVEKERNKLLKRMQKLKPFCRNKGHYEAYYDILEKDGVVNLEYFNRYSNDTKRYEPDVKIAHQEPFKYKLAELKKKPIITTPKCLFGVNYDTIEINLGKVKINSPIGINTDIVWNGKNDEIDYEMKKSYTPELLSDVFQLEIGEDEMSPKWIKIMKKHEDIIKDHPYYEVDIRTAKKGKLKIKRDYRICRLIEE